jgi:predicted MFS family arabinose efflux permease
LVLALLRGNDEGWTSALIVGLFSAAALLLAAFLVIESRIAQPMLPLKYFRSPTFTGAQIIAFAISAAMFASFLYIILYVQNVLGYSPMGAALRFLPVTIASFLIAPLSGVAVAKVPPRLLLALGLGLIAVGLILMAHTKAGDDWTGILYGLILGGIGIGVVNPVLANVALSTVPEEQSGVASGVNDTFRQVGIAAGTAAMGALFLARAQTKVSELLPGTSAAQARGLADGVALGGLPNSTPAHVLAAAREGFFAGFNEILFVAGIVAAAGAVAALILVSTREFESRHLTPQPTPALSPSR